MTTLYGIKNCDTIKKARKWLQAQGIEYSFHDFRSDGLTEKQAKTWLTELGSDVLINRRGTTWRQLPDDVKDNLTNISAIQLMLDNPAIIKRPVLDTGKQRIVGFKDEEYKTLFK